MRVDELQRVADVTANFFFWQGLRWTALGAPMLAGIVIAEQLAEAKITRVVVLVASVVLGLTMSAAAARYYARTYGRVGALSKGNERRAWLKWNIVYPLMIVALIVDALWRGPVLLSGPVWALAIVAYRNSTGRGRAHYFLIAAVLACTFYLPQILEPGRTTFKFFFAMVGAAYVVGGILDHLELRRILRPVVEEQNASAI